MDGQEDQHSIHGKGQADPRDGNEDGQEDQQGDHGEGYTDAIDEHGDGQEAQFYGPENGEYSPCDDDEARQECHLGDHVDETDGQEDFLASFSSFNIFTLLKVEETHDNCSQWPQEHNLDVLWGL